MVGTQEQNESNILSQNKKKNIYALIVTVHLKN